MGGELFLRLDPRVSSVESAEKLEDEDDDDDEDFAGDV
jgi:hypothetical protein